MSERSAQDESDAPPPPTHSRAVPPEGVHFWVEDDGRVLRLTIRSAKKAWSSVSFLAVFCLLAPMIGLISGAPRGKLILWGTVGTALTAFAALCVSMWHEVVEIQGDVLRVRRTLPWPRSRLEFPLRACRIRVLEQTIHRSEDGTVPETFDPLLAIDHGERVLRIGLSLQHAEARQIRDFLVARFPHLSDDFRCGDPPR